jgi:hypothetical protein
MVKNEKVELLLLEGFVNYEIYMTEVKMFKSEILLKFAAKRCPSLSRAVCEQILNSVAEVLWKCYGLVMLACWCHPDAKFVTLL